jgi:hypothetical protein
MAATSEIFAARTMIMIALPGETSLGGKCMRFTGSILICSIIHVSEHHESLPVININAARYSVSHPRPICLPSPDDVIVGLWHGFNLQAALVDVCSLRRS